MRRVPEEAVFGTEYLFRTVEACFFTPNASENASRTPGSLFEHGTHIPYHRWPSPVPNATQRQVAAAAEPGVHFSRPLAGSWLRGYQSCKLPPEIVAYISKYK